MRFHLATLRAASLLVEREQRSDWLAEWSAELWHVRREAPARASAFCLGAFRDAFWLWRNGLPDPTRVMLLASPYRCLFVLAGIAAALGFGAVQLPIRFPGPGLPGSVQRMQVLLAWAGFAFLILPVAARFRAGEYAASRCSPGGLICIRRWLFFAGQNRARHDYRAMRLSGSRRVRLHRVSVDRNPFRLRSRLSLGYRRSAAALPGMPSPALESHSHRRGFPRFPRMVWHRIHLRPRPRPSPRSRNSNKLLQRLALALSRSLVEHAATLARRTRYTLIP